MIPSVQLFQGEIFPFHHNFGGPNYKHKKFLYQVIGCAFKEEAVMLCYQENFVCCLIELIFQLNDRIHLLGKCKHVLGL